MLDVGWASQMYHIEIIKKHVYLDPHGRLKHHAKGEPARHSHLRSVSANGSNHAIGKVRLRQLQKRPRPPSRTPTPPANCCHSLSRSLGTYSVLTSVMSLPPRSSRSEYRRASGTARGPPKIPEAGTKPR